MVLGVISILGLRDIFRKQAKKVVDFREIGLFSRERNDDLKGYVGIQKKYTGSQPYNMIAVIEKRNSQGVFIEGVIGSGKSKVAEELAFVYGTDEIEKIGYDKKTVIIFSPTTHSNNGIMDFRFGIPVIDVSKHLPDVFSDIEAFVGAWKLALTEEITSVGVMARQFPILARKIVERKPRSWDEYFRILQQIKKEKKYGFDNVLLGIVEDMSQVLVGEANPIEFDFSKSVLLDFSKLETPEKIKFYIEAYARIIHKREHDIVKDNNNVLVILDEGKTMMQHGDSTIFSRIIRQGRTYLRPIIICQNYADIPSDLHQVSTEICFKQTDEMSLNQIKARSPFLWECVTKLDSEKREFVDLGDNWHLPDGDLLPIYTLDITRLEQYKQNVALEERENVYVPESQARDNDFVNDGEETWQSRRIDTEEKEGKRKYDSKKTEAKILDVVEASPTGLFISHVIDQVGYKRGEDESERGTTHRLIGKLQKAKKIRIKDYISADKRGHKLVFSKSDEVRAESQVHKRLRDDTKKLLDENKIPNTEGVLNQGYDFSVNNVEIEVETSLKHSLAEWNTKIMSSEKFVITILCNEEDRQRYSYLPCVEAGKTKLVLLSELLETLRNIPK